MSGADEPIGVDLVLPFRQPLGELMPSIVATVLGDRVEPRRWFLTRVAGVALDVSMTLQESGIHDGDAVVLGSARLPPPRRLPTEACAVVAELSRSAPPRPGRGPVLAAAVAGIAVSAMALTWSGLTTSPTWHLWTAAALSAAAAAMSVATGRSDRRLAVLLNTVVMVFAAATGVLAVPGAAWPAVLLLAASSAFATSVVLMRLGRADEVVFAFSAVSVVGALAATVCVIGGPRLEVAGAVAAVLSLAGLSLAPRATIMAAGLGPSRPRVGVRRAGAAHRTLTGLVAGWSASTAIGAIMLSCTATQSASDALLPGAFAANLGVLLLLRQRSHDDVRRRIALGSAGVTALLAALLVAVTAAPHQGFWLCAAATLACAVSVRLSQQPINLDPIARQCIQWVEYVALAAVVPLAFWVSGLYGLVRSANLT